MALRLKLTGAFVLALLWLGVGFAAPANAACPMDQVTVSVQQTPPKVIVTKLLLSKAPMKSFFGTEAEEAELYGPDSLTRPAQPLADDFSQMAAALKAPSAPRAGGGKPGATTCQRAVMFSFPQDRPPNA